MLTWATAAVAAFNLVCSGTVTSEMSSQKKSEPYTYTYRINLNAGLYCAGPCKAQGKIHEIQPTRLILADVRTDTSKERYIETNSIDRETGAHFILISSEMPLLPNSLKKWTGSCEKAPFTGFPKVETKF